MNSYRTAYSLIRSTMVRIHDTATSSILDMLGDAQMTESGDEMHLIIRDLPHTPDALMRMAHEMIIDDCEDDPASYDLTLDEMQDLVKLLSRIARRVEHAALRP